MGLLELMVAIAILGIAAVSYSRYQTNLVNAISHYRIEGEREDVRNRLRMQMTPKACKRTINHALPPAPPAANRCRASLTSPPNRFIAFYNGAGSPILTRFTPAGTPTKIGGFELRAFCVKRARNFELHVEARRTDSSGTPLDDPLTGLTSTWKDLFDDAPLFCELPSVSLAYMSAADVVNRVYYGSSYVPDTAGSEFMDPDNDGGGGRQMPFNAAGERKRVCEYLGMGSVKSYLASTYTSCGNDDVYKWNAAQQKWVLIPNACAAGVNNWIGSMDCAP